MVLTPVTVKDEAAEYNDQPFILPKFLGPVAIFITEVHCTITYITPAA